MKDLRSILPKITIAAVSVLFILMFSLLYKIHPFLPIISIITYSLLSYLLISRTYDRLCLLKNK